MINTSLLTFTHCHIITNQVCNAKSHLFESWCHFWIIQNNNYKLVKKIAHTCFSLFLVSIIDQNDCIVNTDV